MGSPSHEFVSLETIEPRTEKWPEYSGRRSSADFMTIQRMSMMIEAIIVNMYLAGAVEAQLLVVNIPKTIALNTIKRTTGG